MARDRASRPEAKPLRLFVAVEVPREVRAALTDLPGVELRQAAVGAASVAIDPAVTTADALIVALGEAGYQARVAEQALPQSGAAGCCSARQS